MSEFYCPSCLEPRPEGDGYCDVCGTLLLRLRYCDVCGVPAMHSGTYCRECGAHLPEPKPQPPVPPAAPPSPPVAPRRRSTRSRAKAPPVPKTPPPVPASTPPRPAPLTRRPQAAPVVLRAEPPAPTNTTLATVGGVAGTAGVVVSAFNPALGLTLIVLMMLLAGRQTNRATAAAMDRLIDQLWERPGLRRRLLGE